MKKSINLFAFIVVFISITHSLPITRMRVCVQSTDPQRLQSQCVYCNNRSFVATVRHCTGNTYLPADMAVEEAFCLVRICRRQMPAMRPEPFYGTQPTGGEPNFPTINPNDVDYTEPEPLYSGTTSSKKRPPASFSVGKPQRPHVRPLLFGKRSVEDSSERHFDDNSLSS